MKKILFLIALLAAGAGIFWYAAGAPGKESLEIAPSTSRPDPSDATFIFENGPVRVGDELMELTDYLAYGDVNDDGKNDTAVVLVQSGGGSGVFVYVAAYVSGNVTYKGSNAVFVGDRISPESISISDSGIITLNYLDRKPDEPFAQTPTVRATKTFVFRSGELEER